MAKEYWYFVAGVLVVLVPLLLLVAVKKFDLLDARPDEKIVYKLNGAEKLTLHVFHAKNRPDNSPAPALLFFHGGRWLYGEPNEYYPQCQFFVERGYACFSAQYRLGANNQPDVQGAVADVRAAFDYLIEHAAELNIDPRKIIVGGGSAGGHLAAALGSGLPLAADTGKPQARRPFAQLLYNPMLDLAPGTPDHHLVKAYWEIVSPYHHIDSNVSDSLVLLGSQDPEVPVETAQAFCDAVRQAGRRCEVEVYEGQFHGFYHSPEYLEKTNLRILKFLQ